MSDERFQVRYGEARSEWLVVNHVGVPICTCTYKDAAETICKALNSLMDGDGI